MSEKYLDPPEPVWWAECEICGAKRDCGDMQEFEDDIWVCDLKDTDCLDEWKKYNEVEAEVPGVHGERGNPQREG